MPASIPKSHSESRYDTGGRIPLCLPRSARAKRFVLQRILSFLNKNNTLRHEKTQGGRRRPRPRLRLHALHSGARSARGTGGGRPIRGLKPWRNSKEIFKEKGFYRWEIFAGNPGSM